MVKAGEVREREGKEGKRNEERGGRRGVGEKGGSILQPNYWIPAKLYRDCELLRNMLSELVGVTIIVWGYLMPI